MAAIRSLSLLVDCAVLFVAVQLPAPSKRHYGPPNPFDRSRQGRLPFAFPDAFRIHSYPNISHERPWTFYNRLELLTIDYDGGIDLRGLALGQYAKQLSSEQVLNLGSERSLWGILQ